MTSALTEWEVVGPIAANDDTRDMWRQSRAWLWRIRMADGALTCPGQATAGRNGTLLRRKALPLPLPHPTYAVGTQPLSVGPL